MTDAELRRLLLAKHSATGDQRFLEAAQALDPGDAPLDPAALLALLQPAPQGRGRPKKHVRRELRRMARDLLANPGLPARELARREVGRSGRGASAEATIDRLAREFARQRVELLALAEQERRMVVGLRSLPRAQAAAEAMVQGMRRSLERAIAGCQKRAKMSE
jgi:hypothetical protein